MNENNETTTTNTPAPAPEQPAEKTFTQAEVDAIVGRRVAKATKGMPGEEELSKFRAWQESQQTEKERWDTLQKERDESKTALAEALAKVEQYEREKTLLGMGVKADDVDYYVFKIGKMVTDTTDFKKAAEHYLKDNPIIQHSDTVRVDFGAPLSGGQPAKSGNEIMNSLIRGARK